jgi:hypothetical protein
MSREQHLRSRVKALTWFFIVGLFLSGATAIPLDGELNCLVKVSGAEQLIERSGTEAPAWVVWLTRVQTALKQVSATSPFLFYGTDWLAFGHTSQSPSRSAARCETRCAIAGSLLLG